MSECIICYNKVFEKSELNLICECKYTVHNECYRKWYNINKTCIICREYAYPPTNLGRAKLIKDRKNSNTVTRNSDTTIIYLMKKIIVIIILYYIFLKPRLNNNNKIDNEL
jgi:hypothetical protein